MFGSDSRRYRLFFLAFWMACTHDSVQGQGGTAIVQSLKTDAIVGWTELERLQSQTSYALTLQKVTARAGDARQLETSQQIYCYHDGNFLISNGENETWGGNARYNFLVRRPDSKAPWAVRSLAPAGQRDDNGNVIYGTVLRTPWSVFDVPLKTVVADPSFQVVKVTSRTSPGDSAITVQFQIDSNQTNIPLIERLAGGRFICNPSQNWAVESYHVELKPNRGAPKGAHVDASVVYGPPATDYLSLKQLTYALSWENDKGKSEVSWDGEVHSSKKCEQPPNVFSLSAFSLPEPGPLEGERSRFWVWINAVAIILLIVAIWLRRRARAMT